MAKVNGLTIRAKRKTTAEDGIECTIGSLCLGDKKVALFDREEDPKSGSSSVQLFMMRGLSEDRFVAKLAELRGGQDADEVLADLIDEITWLGSLELEFLRHLGSANGAMIVLNFDGGQISIGVPMKYSSASDEEILEMLQGRIRQTEMSYGSFCSYKVFRSMDDFTKGTEITLEEISK